MVVDHNFTVITMDAGYTSNLNANMLVLASGQTVDALMTTSTDRELVHGGVGAHTIELGLSQLPCDPSQMRCNGTTTALVTNDICSFPLMYPKISLRGAHVNDVTGSSRPTSRMARHQATWRWRWGPN